MKIVPVESEEITDENAAEKLGWHVIGCALDGEALPVDSIAQAIYSKVRKGS